MTVKEFLNTCQFDWRKICIYDDFDGWDNSTPSEEYFDVRDIDDYTWNARIDSWTIEGRVLHILI